MCFTYNSYYLVVHVVTQGTEVNMEKHTQLQPLIGNAVTRLEVFVKDRLNELWVRID